MKKKVVTSMAAAAIVSGAYAASASASTHTVQKGDSLSVIAKKYQTSIADLKTLNNLTSDLILISQVLQIPATNAAPVAAQNTSAPAPAANYTVVSGDTLSQIARRNGLSLADLKQWNNLTSDLIFPGQQLKVANGTSTQAAVFAAPPVQVPANTADYLIQSGDTLSKIASKFGTTVTTLKQLNSLSSDLIFAGKSLKVSGTVVPAAAPAAPPPAAAAPAAQPSNTNTYVIQSGDNLSKIAGKFGTTVANLMQLNGLTSSYIYAGQPLTVSGQATATAPTPTNVSTSADTSNSSVAAMVTLVAKGLIGTPYAWGGNTKAGLDCSGFIYYVYNQAGLSLARYSAQGYADRSYEVDKPAPGDLVFFKNTYKAGISHVGIYLGNNQFIQAADEQHGVIISSLTNSYYQQHFDHFAKFY